MIKYPRRQSECRRFSRLCRALVFGGDIMKKEMHFGIKKINVFLICVMVTLTLLTGCSAGTPNADRIKNDLNASDIVGSKEFFGKNG